MQGSVRGWVAESSDRLLASDPGLGRLRSALSGVIAMGTALAVEFFFAQLTAAGPQGTLIAMLLGAIVALMGSTALSNAGAARNALVAAFFPVAIGFGMTVGIAVAGNTNLMLVVFVVIMFVAVFIRRFGLPFFFYGFMAWMGYFFASFLHATFAMLPVLLAAVVVGSAWVLLLSVTVLRANPRRSLRRVLQAYDARARAVARACTAVLDADPGGVYRQARRRRRLRSRQAGLSEAALMVEGWSEEQGALPTDWSGPALRRRLLDVQQIVDRMAASAALLEGAHRSFTAVAARAARSLARREDDSAGVAAKQLIELAKRAEAEQSDGADAAMSARHFAVAMLEFLELSGHASEPPEVEAVDEFSATVSLALGNLPGTPGMFRDVAARGASWNPLARLDMTTRQAIQVAIAGALAILIGRELSVTRYYWAVIAAFVAFTGTATRSETFIKALNRVLGTMLGLIAAIWLANLTAGRTGWVLTVILVSMFAGTYLVRVSYAYMIFFITIMIAQLYSVLHEFSDALLVLRLEETAIGAASGIAVALVFTPLSTRDAVDAARSRVLASLCELLAAAAEGVSTATVDLDALSRALDDRVRQLAMVAKPLIRPFPWRSGNPRTRHRLGLYYSTSVHARSFAVRVRSCPPELRDAAGDACRALADVANLLAGVGAEEPAGAVESAEVAEPAEDAWPAEEAGRADDVGAMMARTVADALADADRALFQSGSAVPGEVGDLLLRPLVHIHDVLSELATTPGAV